MNENVLGPALSVALFLGGIWLGWRAARLREGETSILTQGFRRGAPKPLRVAAFGFGGALSAFLLRLLTAQMDSPAFTYVAVAIIAISIGIGWGAVMRGWREAVRSSPDGTS